MYRGTEIKVDSVRAGWEPSEPFATVASLKYIVGQEVRVRVESRDSIRTREPAG
jgi:hypothetical protein